MIDWLIDESILTVSVHTQHIAMVKQETVSNFPIPHLGLHSSLSILGLTMFSYITTKQYSPAVPKLLIATTQFVLCSGLQCEASCNVAMPYRESPEGASRLCRTMTHYKAPEYSVEGTISNFWFAEAKFTNQKSFLVTSVGHSGACGGQ